MSIVVRKWPLGFTWETEDPFLFCVHHLDIYPKGNEHLGPVESLSSRKLGNDFDMNNEWKMYHGHKVPGFPEHPHRGFETVTVTLEGFVDHFDSSGSSGRYGQGDVQWMTAGSGLQHSEMFPLLNQDTNNTLHLFQIWLNLPKKDKFAEPFYKMLWHEDIPIVKAIDSPDFSVHVISGEFSGVNAVEPAPNSWANNPDNHVDILRVEMDTNAVIYLPKKSETINRNIYFYNGDHIDINGESLKANYRYKLNSNDVTIKNTGKKCSLLILQGEPINEPIVQYGPFVMNTKEEIQTAYDDYHKTRFGGWPWDSSDPVHPISEGRIAYYVGGNTEKPDDNR